MRLLVSVASAAEARAAAAGGADVIDAKDPASGALGAVRPEVLSEIHAAIEGRLLTAALGDAEQADAVEAMTRSFVTRGARFVKLGFAGIDDERRVGSMIAAAVRGYARSGDVRPGGVVAVAYADADPATSIDRMALTGVAARTGAVGVLLDTADKRGASLTALCTGATLARWVAEAHGHGLFAALAGKLTAEDIAIVREAGADIAGVRGAVCDGGRTGVVTEDRVRAIGLRLASG